MKFIFADRSYIQGQSPTSSVFSTGAESDSRISSSLSSASEYSYGDSSNAFNMETLNLAGNSTGELIFS